MTPLSLVGMSMRARKRAAMNEAGVNHPSDCIGWDLWKQVYRIGEHLRPCLTCDGGRWYVAPDVGCVDCGSAGVLPAKRSVKP